MKSLRVLLMGIVLCALGACSPQRSFTVAVTNKSEVAITIGLVKSGPPFEQSLASVDELAVTSPIESLAPWGMVVPPGKSVETQVKGKFPEGTELYLRAYLGKYSNVDLISMSRGNPFRTDVLLFPGANELVISDERGKVVYQRLKPGNGMNQ